jgi:putative tricarboxylic transport membrane protein
MRYLSKLSVLFVVAVLVAFGAGNALGAGKFPEKPITIIVHASAGGGSDMFARTISAAVAYVAGKKKDPYFMVTATPTFLTTPIMGLTPVSLKDFTPIANLAFDELVLSVGAASKYKSLKDVLADAKANPKKISLAVTQLGGPDTVCASMVEQEAGVQFNSVVFNGQADANVALLGNHVDMSIGNPGESLELAKAGKIRILGIFSDKRMSEAPDIPTMKEQGLNVIFRQNRSLVAPADIPADARKILEETLLKVTQTDIFKKYCKDNLISEAYIGGDDFTKYLTEMSAKYAVVLKAMNLIKKK